ncbi:hypothetical protein DL768_008747 [Monosporascus sp. mg162]|nr:hypothetical protein DL768_008747 [Monosporascus sp. mg162]
MADDKSNYEDCGKDEAASVASTVSWNTFLSRTNVSSLTCAMFSEQENQFLHGLDDVIRAVTALGLRRYRYEEIAREEKVGEGETYVVERCVVASQVLAVKHLKTNTALDDKTSRRRLRAIMPYILVQYAPKGTLRQYLKSMSSQIPLRDLQILAGDVASALSALHTCGIVHGDVKLDNVLVVHSWDRPAQALAKLIDFGHALVVNDKSSKHGGTMRYGGTFMCRIWSFFTLCHALTVVRYNAPEVHDQNIFPIDRAAMTQCDIWAFGVLVWELCLQGEDHLSYSKRRWPEIEPQMTEQRLNPADVRRYAMASVPGKLDYMLIRATLHRTLQEDPTKRIAHLEDLPLLTEWNEAGIGGLESELALHLERPSPTYEMFRSENGREIPWKHEEQIFQGLKRTHTNRHAKDNSSVSWQLALCHHVGFGTPRSPASARQYAKIAQEEGHPVAAVFASLLDLNSTAPSEPYATKLSRLIRSTTPPHCLPPLIQACFDGDSKTLTSLLSQNEDPNSSTIDGCTMFHWLFMLEDPEAMVETLKSMFAGFVHFHTDLPFSCLRKAHDQWPLQLLGNPLGAAISVNSLPTVKALLALGASPLAYVYRREDFPAGDPRVNWTALHLAAKYHCSEIFHYLLSSVPKASLSAIYPLASVLPFSTSLERLAMHGTRRQEELDKTVTAIRKVQSLQTALLSGMTALTQAIDFQDYDVVAALLRAEPKLASRRLASVEDPAVFNLPIHLAAQLAARRDPSRDHLGMTPLHLAVTGPSSRAARWILEQRMDLLEVEDNLGRTALHCCASDANLELLLARGSAVKHTDKYGMTTLHRACLRGELEIVRCLLKHSPPLGSRNNMYGTPLHCAIINGSVDVVTALLEAGAPINTQDCRGNTPVHVAVRMGRYMILRNLLERGGSRSIQNLNGRTPENLASIIGTTHSIAALNILQGGRKTEVATYLFSEDNTAANFGFLPRMSRKGKALPPDFAWDANDVAPEALPESNTSSQNEAGTIVDEELPAFPDGTKEKEKKLQELAAAIANDMHYSISWLINDQVTTDLHAQIIPYLNDSIWQDTELSAVPIGKVLAGTVFGIGKIMKMVADDTSSILLAPTPLIRASASWAPSIGSQKVSADGNTQDAANEEAEDERNASISEGSSGASEGTQAEALIRDEEEEAERREGEEQDVEREIEKPKTEKQGEVKEEGDKQEVGSGSSQNSEAAEFVFIDPFSACEDEQDIAAKPEQGSPPTYLQLEGHIKFAIDQTLKIVEQTKPIWALPARSRSHLQKIITWEVIRIQITGDMSTLNTPLNNAPSSMTHPIMKRSWASDQKTRRTQLQQRKWRSELEAYRI